MPVIHTSSEFIDIYNSAPCTYSSEALPDYLTFTEQCMPDEVALQILHPPVITLQVPQDHVCPYLKYIYKLL